MIDEAPGRRVRPLRALHVIGSLGRGGAETWLVQVVRCLDRSRVMTDIAVNDAPGGAYRAVFESLCCGIHHLGAPDLGYAHRLRRLQEPEHEIKIVR